MKRKFEALRENLDEFVVQNDYPVLAVGCLPEELAYVVKFLQALDEKHPASFFVVFPQTFNTAAECMDLIAAGLRDQLEAAGQARAQRGEPPFPPMPVAIADRQRKPEARLLCLLDYLRRLLPNEQDHRAVVGLLPLECANVEAYAEWIGSVLPIRDFPPWMQALRVVVYDDRSQRRIAADVKARKIERVLTFDVDFSTAALTNALSIDAADTSLPIPERMANVLQLAALDYSYKRYPDALAKYGVLFTFYEGAGLPSMASLCLLGAGDTLRASGEKAAAKETLQRGIALALEHKALAMVLNGLLSIVEVSFELGHHEDAESYADSGAQVAAGVMNPFACADLCERKGDAQVAQRKRADAIASYARCRELSAMYDHTHRSESVLRKLVVLYGEQDMEPERRAAERDLGRLNEGKGAPSQPPGARGEGTRT